MHGGCFLLTAQMIFWAYPELSKADNTMRLFKRLSTAALALMLMTSVPQAASANEMISKDLAIKFANKYIPGEILSANSRSEDGQTYYDLVIRNAKGVVFDVTVDALTGRVIKATPRDTAQ